MDIRVQCKCGWQGQQSQIEANQKKCPTCGAHFVSWPIDAKGNRLFEVDIRTKKKRLNAEQD